MSAYNIWHDPTIKAAAADLLALVPEADKDVLRRWMADPSRLTAAELAQVEDSILPAIREALGMYGEQPRYRWVDSRTGEVDD